MMQVICPPGSGGGKAPQEKLYSGGEVLLLYSVGGDGESWLYG